MALTATRKAGVLLLDKFQGQKRVSYKGQGNPVTDVDRLVEEELITDLAYEFPETRFLAEESGVTVGASEYTWIIDPLDGTRNYILGIPFFSVAVALVREEEILFGLTYDPVREEMFQAVKGFGAKLNELPISASTKLHLDEAVLSFDLGSVDPSSAMAMEMVLNLWGKVQATRIMGSAALGLAYAAAGRVDIYFHHKLEPWDVASGILLVREAGGEITDKFGNQAGVDVGAVIAGGPEMHRGFLEATAGEKWRM